jgi:hypothetical protein
MIQQQNTLVHLIVYHDEEIEYDGDDNDGFEDENDDYDDCTEIIFQKHTEKKT